MFGQNNFKKRFFSPPDYTKNAVIYEVNIRQYSKEGKIQNVTSDLPRLKDLGVDILWLMPLQPIGEKNRKGKLGSYYSIKDYTAVNPEFGTIEDVKNLVKKAHELKMKVILDWVANHTAWDHVWVEQYPEFYTADDQGKRPIVTLNNDGTPTDWTDTADLNYSNPLLRTEMTKAMAYWIKEADLDGFRCDVAGMVPIDFWLDARKELHKIKKVFMLAEWDGPEIMQAFDACYGWELKDFFVKFTKKEKTLEDLLLLVKDWREKYQLQDIQMLFTTNHDINSWDGTEKELYGQNSRNFSIITFTLGGMPLIYNGQESGLFKKLEFFEKDYIDWGTYTNTKFFKSLARIYKDNPALWNGKEKGKITFITSQNANPNLLVYEISKGKNTLVVALNLDSKSAELTTELPNTVDLISEKDVRNKKSGKVVIPAYGGYIFKKS